MELLILSLLAAAGGLLAYAVDRSRAAHRFEQRLQQETKRLEQLLAEREQAVRHLQKQSEGREADSIQSKALFLATSTVAYDIVLVLDDEMAVLATNKSAEELLGHPYPIGEKLESLLDNPELCSVARAALDNDDVLEDQIRIGERIFRVRTCRMPYTDQHAFIGIALQDISQLVKLNRARRDLVANISHELRTPIANIRLTIDSLFHERNKPKRKDSISSLRDIARETDTLLWLVQELLDLSMIESGQAIMKLVDVPLAGLVQEAVDRLEDQMEIKGLQAVSRVPPALHVLCDPDQTRRVLVNLIHNAIKWSPPNETITIDAVEDGEETTVSVFDNGPGVPADQAERIFERFYQMDASRSKGDGTGLGLAICKHIVEAQGGHIWVEPAAQGGGRFKFTLLRAEAAPDSDLAAPEADAVQ